MPRNHDASPNHVNSYDTVVLGTCAASQEPGQPRATGPCHGAGGSGLRCRLRANRCDDLGGFGPTSAEQLAEETAAARGYGLSIDLHFELTPRADHEFRGKAELALDGDSETRCLFAVASGLTVENSDLHRASNVHQRGGNLRGELVPLKEALCLQLAQSDDSRRREHEFLLPSRQIEGLDAD